MRQPILRFLTANSVRKIEASKAPVSFSVLTGGADGGGEFLFVKLLFLAQADEQDAFAKRSRHIVQQQRTACLAFHVAAADDVGNVAVTGCLVEQFGGASVSFLDSKTPTRRRRYAAFPGYRFLC
jgi:hypothetical protein